MSTQSTQSQVNGISLDVLKQTIGAIQQDPELAKCEFRARNKWIDANHNRSRIEGFYGARQEMEHQQAFEVDADEPMILAGQDQAPNPVEHLLSSLAACLTTSMVAHAAVRGIEIEELESEIEGDIDLRGFLGLAADVPRGYQKIRATFRVKSDADEDKLKSLAEFSPTYNTVMSGVNVDVRVESKGEETTTPSPTIESEAGREAP